MSTFNGKFNYKNNNNSYDWDVVIAGTGDLELTDVIDEGDVYAFKNHPAAPSNVVEIVGNGTDALGNIAPVGYGQVGGEAIPDGSTLFFDGVDSNSSNNGQMPIDGGSNLRYIPAYCEVDGNLCSNGPSGGGINYKDTHGTKFIGAAYENLARVEDFTADTNATLSEEGGWQKVTATATVASSDTASVIVTHSALTNYGSVDILIKRGNTDISRVNSRITGAWVTIDWTDPTVSGMTFTGVTDNGTFFITDRIVRLRFTTTAAVGSIGVRVYAKSYASATTGDYTFFANPMHIDIDYPVPYVEVAHEASECKIAVDWAESTDHSVECRVMIPNIAAAYSKAILEVATGGQDGWRFAFDSLGVFRTTSFSGGSTTGSNSISPVAGQWYHCKIVTTAASVRTYINGVLESTISTNVSASSLWQKMIYVGQYSTGVGRMNGYITHVLHQYTADTDTAHGLGTNLWFDPGTKYGKNCSSFERSVCVQEEPEWPKKFTLDGQNITRWENGLMMNTGTGALPTSYLVPFVDTYYEQATGGDYLVMGSWK